jgi:hypothetical protein
VGTVDRTIVSSFRSQVFRGSVSLGSQVFGGGIGSSVGGTSGIAGTIEGAEIVFQTFNLRGSRDECEKGGKEKKMLELHVVNRQ